MFRCERARQFGLASVVEENRLIEGNTHLVKKIHIIRLYPTFQEKLRFVMMIVFQSIYESILGF